MPIIGALEIFRARTGTTTRDAEIVAHETDGRRMAGDDASNRPFFSIKSCVQVQSSRSMRARAAIRITGPFRAGAFAGGDDCRSICVGFMAKPRPAVCCGLVDASSGLWLAAMDGVCAVCTGC